MEEGTARAAIGVLSLAADEMMELTLMSNAVLGGDSAVNCYQVRNSRALAKANPWFLTRMA